MRPEFNDLVPLDNLEAALLPQGINSEDNRRLIFIGDVHGCNDECKATFSSIWVDAPNHAHLFYSERRPHSRFLQAKNRSFDLPW